MHDASRKVLRFDDGEAQRLRFLADVGQVLAESLDLQRTVTNLARLAVPTLADFCLIDLLEGGELVRAGAAHTDRAQDAAMESLVTPRPLAQAADHPVAQAWRSGEPVLLHPLADRLALVARGDEDLARLAPLEAQSALFVPLVSRDRALGVMELFVTTALRGFSRAHVQLAQDLARRAAPALESARLFEDAQQAVRMREEILAVVSHDLRNPLSRIYLATDQLHRIIPAEHARHVEIIRRSAQHMNRLIQDLLEITKLEAGQLPLDRRCQDIRPALREAVDLVAPRMEQKGLQLDETLDDQLPTVIIDRARIVQVLGNLLDNAIRHTPEGGRIGIDARFEEPNVVVTVRDSGSGIDPEVLPHLFNRYRRSTKRFSREGVGLGLAIARGIVEAHGGTIRATSSPGAGSSFQILLAASTGPTVAATGR